MNKLFTKPNTKWTDGIGPDADIVIASRVRLARNIAELPLPHKGDSIADEQVFYRCKAAVKRLPDSDKYSFYALPEIAPVDRRLLVEKHLISAELARGGIYRGIAVRDDEGVSVMINEEDHIRIQCLLPGLQLEDAWRIASQVDDALESELDIAFDPSLGYLTACPTNVGTGMRTSVMMHLPALEMSKQLRPIFANLSRLGMAVRGMYGEGSDGQGNLYQISNQITLGVSETEIISRMQQIVRQLLDEERKARSFMQAHRAAEVADNVWRSYGILKNARLLPAPEMMERLSYLRLGYNMGIVSAIPAKTVNELMIMGQSAYLQKRAAQPLDEKRLLWERAKMIRDNLPLLNEENITDPQGKEK